jgi:hypothetical protein
MKTTIKVQTIEDPKTKVPINSPMHRIEEIKKGIKNCLATKNLDVCKAEVLEMWNDS